MNALLIWYPKCSTCQKAKAWLDEMCIRDSHLVGAVFHVDLLAALLVLLGKGLGVLHGLVDVVLGHVGGGGNGDVLLFAGTQVLGVDVDDAVGVDVKGDLDLGHPSGGGGDAVQVEAAQGLVEMCIRDRATKPWWTKTVAG